MMGSDFSELDDLVRDLTGASEDTRPFIKAALKVNAHKVRDDAREEAARTGLKSYGASIGYDVTETAGEISAEIGPTPGRRQASFGFMEDGGSRVKSAPQHALRNARNNNLDDLHDGLERALHDGLEESVGG